MRWSVLTACLLGFGLGLTGGCFHPDVKNGGFACSQTDNPPCPSGFFCVNGLCEDHPGSGGEVDLSTGTGGNGGGGGGGGGGGMGSTDMAHPTQDMAGSGDMAQPPMCAAQGASCNGNGDCCMMVCFLSTCLF